MKYFTNKVYVHTQAKHLGLWEEKELVDLVKKHSLCVFLSSDTESWIKFKYLDGAFIIDSLGSRVVFDSYPQPKYSVSEMNQIVSNSDRISFESHEKRDDLPHFNIIQEYEIIDYSWIISRLRDLDMVNVRTSGSQMSTDPREFMVLPAAENAVPELSPFINVWYQVDCLGSTVPTMATMNNLILQLITKLK